MWHVQAQIWIFVLRNKFLYLDTNRCRCCRMLRLLMLLVVYKMDTTPTHRKSFNAFMLGRVGLLNLLLVYLLNRIPHGWTSITPMSLTLLP